MWFRPCGGAFYVKNGGPRSGSGESPLITIANNLDSAIVENNITDEINDRDETTIYDFSQVDEIFDGEHILLEDDITADDKLWSAIGYLLPIFAIV